MTSFNVCMHENKACIWSWVVWLVLNCRQSRRELHTADRLHCCHTRQHMRAGNMRVSRRYHPVAGSLRVSPGDSWWPLWQNRSLQIHPTNQLLQSWVPVMWLPIWLPHSTGPSHLCSQEARGPLSAKRGLRLRRGTLQMFRTSVWLWFWLQTTS